MTHLSKLIGSILMPALFAGCSASQLPDATANSTYDIDVSCFRKNYNEGQGKAATEGIIMATCFNGDSTDVTFNIQCKANTLNVVDSEVFCSTMDNRRVRIRLVSEWTNEEANEIMKNL